MGMGITSNYIGASSQLGDAVAINRTLGNDIAIGGYISIYPIKTDSVGQGTWAAGTDTNAYHNFKMHNDVSHSDGDNFSLLVYLPAGVYTIRHRYRTDSTNGKVDMYIDATKVMSALDTYSAGGVNSNFNDTTNVNISTCGIKTLKWQLNGKNALASEYRWQMNDCVFIRTA